MGFSRDWDELYGANKHLAEWPWSDVVSLVHRYGGRPGPGMRVLELGCGAGANVPFFKALGVRYRAIEGSLQAVCRLHERFPELRSAILAGDFTEEIPFEAGFDLVVDRAAVTHNDAEGIEACLWLAWRCLKSGALFIGVDWFSTQHSEFTSGQATSDPYTRKAFTTGPFAGTGNVHFCDESHLRHLFRRFDIVLLEEKVVRSVSGAAGQFAGWNIVARKPND